MRARVFRRHLGRELGRSWWQWAVLLGWVLTLQVVALAWAKQAHAQTTVPYFKIQAQDSYASARRYAGVTAPARSAQLGFKRSGEVAQVLVDQGASVAKGQALAHLDAAGLRAELQQADANVAHAAANLNAHRAAAQLAMNTEQRMRKLRASGHASKQTYDEVFLDLQAKAAQVEVAKANKLRAEAAQQAARVALEEAAIIAPFEGVVQARYLDEGSQVQPGQAVLKVIETGAVEAHVGVPSAVAPKLQPGTRHTLYSNGAQLVGRLTTVLPEVDRNTRTVNAIFTLEDASPRSRLTLGAVVELEFTEQVASPGFWLPMSALTAADRGLWSVYVINPDDIIERRLLEIVHSEADRVFARGTLSDADRVVHTGVQRVVPGQAVVPVAALQARL